MKRLLTTLAIVAVLASLPLMTAQAATQCAARHTVLRGENLFRIGLRYGIQWPAIASANGIADPRTLRAGQVLCIPFVLSTVTPTVTATAPGATLTPVPTTTITPTPVPTLRVPRISIVGVVRDQTVTISAADFPASQSFDVLMGPIGTRGVGGTKVATQSSGTGVFTATYSVPESLRGARQISIRLQSASGYFSFNWFHNQ
jgi:hypothetical protein